MTRLSFSWSGLYSTLMVTLITLSVSALNGQSDYGCPIFIENNNDLSSITAGPGMVTNMMNYGVQFDGITNLYGRDNLTADITLGPKKSSNLLYASGFDLGVPTGVNITGVEVIVTADVSVPSAIRDVRVSLATGPNQPLGTDKSNLSLGGASWGSADRWYYGSVLDMWGTTIDQSTVNSNSFGVLLQISNRADTTVMAFIDQLAVRVYYQPVLQICGHPCIALSAPIDPEVVSYSWNVQGALVAEASNQLDHVVNIFAEQSPFGEYEVCLTRRFANGQTDNCCRPLHYDDCSEGSIGDRIWEDTNGNGIQDPGEQDMGACNVRLYDASFNLLASTISVNGRYLFSGLQKGKYVVAIDTKGLSPTRYTTSDSQNNSDLSGVYLLGSTGIIDLASGEHRTDIDFGLVDYGGLCGHAWRDVDGDGQQTDTDVVLPSITVNLYDSGCAFLTSTVTDGAGNYCFDNLAEADYFIDFDLPEGYFAGGYGLVNTVDPLTGKIPVSISYGEFSFGNDIMAFKDSSLGDRVWADENENGIQDPGEPGIEGVMLNLFTCADVLVQSVTSGADGSYNFTGLRPGEYYICVQSTPTGYTPTAMVIDPGVGSHLGSNGCTDCIQLMDDTDREDVDLGFIFGISNIGDQVWFDENENGVFNLGEIGLADVTLHLQDCNGNVIQSQVTDADGLYLFSDVPAADYRICIEEDYRDYRTNPLFTVNGNCTDCFTHTGSSDNTELDFNLIYEKATADTKVWIDENGNGIREDFEPLLEGVVTEFYTCDNQLIGQDTSDNIGGAWFADVCAGDYYFKVILPDGYEFITNGGQITGANGPGTSDCFSVLGFGRTINVGLVPTDVSNPSICASVWNDVNENDFVDAGENPLAGIQIDLYNCVGLFVASFNSDGFADDCLEDLESGEYYLSVVVPQGYSPTINGVLTDSFGPGTSSCFQVNDEVDINIGLVEDKDEELPRLDAVLFEDLNQNGIHDSNEPLFENLSADLYRCDGTLFGAMSTDNLGSVWYEDVPPGDYYIVVETQAGYSFTIGGEITETNGPGSTNCFTVANDGRTVNAGYVRESALPRLDAVLFEDFNQNGIHDTNEPLFENLTADLYRCDGNLFGAMSTDNLGSVWYEDVPSGDYYIVVETQAGYSFTTGGEITETNGPGSTDCFTVTNSGRTVNAGYVRDVLPLMADISGKVWFDENEDGMMDDNELGMNQVLVRLYDESFNLLDEKYSNESGVYKFQDLGAADYFLQFQSPNGYEYTQYRAGGNSGYDSEVQDFTLGMTGRISFSATSDMDGINAGLILQSVGDGFLGGKVWVDLNNNSTEDIGEEGFEEMLVILYDDLGFSLGTTFTDEEGNYAFTGLQEGNYILDFELPEGFQYSTAYVGSDEELDSDVIDYNNGRTAVIFLPQSAVENNISVGLQKMQLDYASVAGTVWVDANEDGYLDTNESGIPNSLVIIYDENNNLYAQTVTNDVGQYKIQNIVNGRYFMQFQSAGTGFTDAKVGANSDLDSEVTDFSNGTTEIYELLPGEDLVGINAGVQQVQARAEIKGMVWLDADEDGLIGSAENGLDNISVTLIDDTNTEVAQTTTNADGEYAFTGLSAGLYYLSFDIGSYLFTTPKAGGNASDDSEVVNTYSGFTTMYVLNGGDVLTDINAGLYEEDMEDPEGSISGTVWLDSDEDGLIGTSETGLANITVTLIDDTKTEVAQTTTDAEGDYSFTGLAADLYYLSFDNGAYKFTTPQAGGTATDDSEVLNTFEGYTGIYVLREGDQLTDINAGLNEETFQGPDATISGIVWLDTDQSGMIDNNESGIENIVIRLFDDTSTEVSQTVTDEDGNYTFFNLEEGLYYVNVERGDYDFVSAYAGGTSDLDSEVLNTDLGYTVLYVLRASQNLTGINAGLFEIPSDPVTITGRVWEDQNKDGFIDDQEPGMEGVAVSLYDISNTLVALEFSEADGSYAFTDIMPGLYYLTFDKPEDYMHTSPKAGGNSLVDSEVVNFNNTNTVIYDLDSGEMLEGINAGFYLPTVESSEGIIAGQVWEDLDGNGMLDSDETLTESVIVILRDDQGNSQGLRTTDADGSYSFGPLDEGDYTVEFTLPLDSKVTKQDAGNDDLDSDIDEMTTIAEVTLGDTDQTGVNAGFYYPVSIGDYVWLDVNSDGIQEIDERGANNYIINLYDGDNNFIKREWSNFDVNGNAGKYLFSDLAPGEYIIKVSSQQGVAFSPVNATSSDSDSDITNNNGLGSTDIIFLESGTQRDDIDIGLVLAPATLGDRLWLDENGDGVQDDGEPGLNDVTVNLFNIYDGLVESTTTATVDGEDGIYSFEDVYPTEYYVQFEFSDEYILTTPDVGGVDSKDSDIDNSNGAGTTSIFLLSPGETDLDIDGGVFLDAYIGDKVWHDRNKDGMQDSNEPGVENVEIELYRVTTQGDILVQTTDTDRFGEYRFSQVSNGDYYLIFYPEDDFEMTDQDVGMDETTDSDASKTGITDIITITSSTSNATIDVGLIRPDNQLRGFAWDDLDQNGLYSFGEPLLEGVTLWLMNANDQVMTEVESEAAGIFLFDDINDGDYYIKANAPAGYEFTIKDFGIDDDIDSDFDSNGDTDMFTFSGETVLRNINAGFVPLKKKSLSIYPNPVSGPQLQVSTYVYEDGLDVSSKILDHTGIMVTDQQLANNALKGNNEYTVDLKDVSEGLFVLKVQAGKSVEYIKFMKIRE